MWSLRSVWQTRYRTKQQAMLYDEDAPVAGAVAGHQISADISSQVLYNIAEIQGDDSSEKD